MWQKFRLFRQFVGPKVVGLVCANFLAGVMWFAVELGFLAVIQGFLFSIGFLDAMKTNLPSWYPTDLQSSLIILIVYGLFRAIVNGFKNMLPVLVSQVFAAEQRRKIVHYSFFSNHNRPTAELLATFGDLTTKASYFVQHASNALSAAAAVTLLIALSLKLAPYEAVISFALLLCIVLPFRRLNKKIGMYGEELVRDSEKSNKVLVEGLRNIFLLKLYRVLGLEYAKAETALKSYEKQYTKYMSIATLASGLPLFAGLVIIAGVTFLSKEHFHTDANTFVAFLYVFLRTATNASVCSLSFSDVLFYKNSFSELYKASLDSTATGVLNSGEPDVTTLKQPLGIQFQSVDFSYSPESPILKNLNLGVKPGEFLLIKGPSGAGKSTIIKLIVGMLAPQKGEVRIENESAIKFLERSASSVGYVGPDPFIVPATVRENLLYGSSAIVNDNRLWAILERVGLSETIRALPGGLSELLNEETQLSTGQKQRIAFARAILRDPRLLILDEATANIDKKTETLILNSLKEMKGQVTVVAISHRDSFDFLADQMMQIRETEVSQHAPN